MRYRTVIFAAAALLLLAACGSDKNNSTATGGTGTGGSSQPTFVLSEFKISLEGTIPAGQVDLRIDNQGGEKHEVVFVAGKDAASLPKKADGSVDEDKIPEADKLGESGDVPARTSSTKSFTFKPGTYVAFCNIVDDMGMTGTTMMGGGTTGGGNMPMNSGPTGNNSNSTMMGGAAAGAGVGHVHFAQGMYTTFTVK
jgi:plastocyanin